jgi:hypothetical protein
MPNRFCSLFAITVSLWSSIVAAQTTAPASPPPFEPKPVPRVQVFPQAHDQASFQVDGRELTRYHFGADGRRTYLFPLNGPSGKSVTRIGHPHDPVSHSHHNSVWVSHFSVDGVDFWGDRGKGRIVHQRIERYEDGDTAASLTALNHWVNDQGEVLLEERRRIEVEPLANGEWLTTIDLELSNPRRSITLEKTPFGLLGVRMAKTIGVHDGGGRIRNSEGGVNETGVFWKPARWCDYSGAVANGVIEGLTLLDHPQNPNHPTVFHVRDDGWMGASLTFDAPRTVDKGVSLRLRYGLYVHRGLADPAAINARWSSFAATTPPTSLAPVKKTK